MLIKPAHLRHPLRSAKLANAKFLKRLKMGRFAAWGNRHFSGDPRYNLQNVIDGFAPRGSDTFNKDTSKDDTEALQRICAAYAAAVKDQQACTAAYRPTTWWERVRQGSLKPVTQALQSCDISSLRQMYRNFFRDPCSIGLIGTPYGMPNPGTGGIKDLHRRVYLADTLCRIDYWSARTAGRFALRELAGPGLGNPYGAVIDGMLIEVGAEYRHYCAQTIASLLQRPNATVAEVGGGFGGMAFYLLRDRPGIKYLDFDVPESLALTSYYLMTAFPDLKFWLYGESSLTSEAIAGADVALLPLPQMAALLPNSVDLFFSSYAMSGLSPQHMGAYLQDILRMNAGRFLYVGNERSARVIADIASTTNNRLQLADARPSEWHKHTNPEISEVECLYRISPERS